MRIGVVAVGRLKAGPERDLAARYVERFAALAAKAGLQPLTLHELGESRARRPDDRRIAEARSILAVVPPGGRLVVLDEGGASLNSAAFAARIRKARDAGEPGLAFVVGGPDGTAAPLRAKADLCLALGTMTWPHQIVRVLLAEQLYRAATILVGHPYHRD